MMFSCYSEAENAAEICVLPGGSPFDVGDRPDEGQEFIAGEPVKISAAFYFGVDLKSRRLTCSAEVKGNLITIETYYE